MSWPCWLVQAQTANAAGLLGTCILAWGAIRIVPAATRAYRVTEALANLAELRRQRAAPKATPLSAALAAQFDTQEQNLETVLTSSLNALTAVRDRWTRWHTVLMLVGVLLSAASDLLPLIAPPPAPACTAAPAQAG